MPARGRRIRRRTSALRHRLPHTRWHLHSRLHQRRRPRRSPRQGLASPDGGKPFLYGEPGDRRRLVSKRSHVYGRSRDRQEGAAQDRPAAGWRSTRAGCRSKKGAADPELEDQTLAARQRLDCVEVDAAAASHGGRASAIEPALTTVHFSKTPADPPLGRILAARQPFISFHHELEVLDWHPQFGPPSLRNPRSWPFREVD